MNGTGAHRFQAIVHHSSASNISTVTFQAALYPTGSEDQPEDALTWEPGEMEFDDEFSPPQSTILATLLAHRSEEESYSGVPPKLVSDQVVEILWYSSW